MNKTLKKVLVLSLLLVFLQQVSWACRWLSTERTVFVTESHYDCGDCVLIIHYFWDGMTILEGCDGDV
jgi:hypothetical protein